jgi:prolyl-tRNA editing enzyme YbaK/EbsC (Cys-tRNA(Pro) deacylase)
MRAATHPDALRVQAVLGAEFAVLEFDVSTHTSQDAAAAIGCTVDQIAKSLIFLGKTSGRAVLAVASGGNRVDEKKVAALIGEKIGRADPAFVLEATGFAVGGVPPVGHAVPSVVLLDEDLRRFDRICAAAGTANAVFALTPDALRRLTGAHFADIARR